MTRDGLRVYDLAPQAAENWIVAGPDGVDPETIDAECLPAGFRWVHDVEWSTLQQPAPPQPDEWLVDMYLDVAAVECGYEIHEGRSDGPVDQYGNCGSNVQPRGVFDSREEAVAAAEAQLAVWIADGFTRVHCRTRY